MTDQGIIRILIAHCDSVSRGALAAVLSEDPQIEVVRTTGVVDACALLSAIQQSSIDIVLLHSEADGKATRHCARVLSGMSHDARLFISGIKDVDRDIVSAIESGAAGVATRQTTLEDFVANLKAIAEGETLCPPHVARLLFSKVAEQSLGPSSSKRRSKITRREKQVAELIEQGLTNKQIAVRLSIEVQTVKNHVHNILEKLNFRRRAEVARYAREVGWFSTGTSTRRSSKEQAALP